MSILRIHHSLPIAAILSLVLLAGQAGADEKPTIQATLSCDSSGSINVDVKALDFDDDLVKLEVSVRVFSAGGCFDNTLVKSQVLIDKASTPKDELTYSTSLQCTNGQFYQLVVTAVDATANTVTEKTGCCECQPLAEPLSLLRSGGVLGQSASYTLAGPSLASGGPAQLAVLIPGLVPASTPLALLDPFDLRALGVGLELLSIAKVGVLDPEGFTSFTYPLPLAPSLVGLPFLAQAFTLPGSSGFVVGPVSNLTSVVLGAPGSSVPTHGDLLFASAGHTATAQLDGDVFVAGGVASAPSAGFQVLDRFELYDPQSQTFSVVDTAVMQHPRSRHSATRLGDGRILLAGGTDASGLVRGTIDIWDPVTKSSAPGAPMSVPRVFHTATPLQDGRVFVSGGYSSFVSTDPVATQLSALSSTEIFDLITNTWSAGPNLPAALVGHRASMLETGEVLITGGTRVISHSGLPAPLLLTSAVCQRYDPTSNTLAFAAALPTSLTEHAQVSLPSGDVVVAGGGVFTGLSGGELTPLGETYRYLTETDVWFTTGTLNHARYGHEIARAGDALIFFGGRSGSPSADEETIETTDFTFFPTYVVSGKLLHPRPEAASVVIDDGQRMLTTGGASTGLPGKTAEIYVLP